MSEVIEITEDNVYLIEDLRGARVEPLKRGDKLLVDSESLKIRKV